MDRIVLHVDMNSYFATLEQQANPLLRGQPIAVSGRPHIYSVVAAASIEAKKFGVRSGMNTIEAKKLCPRLIFIPGDPAKYIDITGKLIKIFKSYTPMIEIFSIDEVFLEVFSDPKKIALEIKSRIKTEIGNWMVCSIGIAPNKLLAKLASEKQKPDGLTIIDKNNLDEMLLSSKLDDFCGIGRKILERLQEMGIENVTQLRKISEEYLVAAFGIRGKEIRNMAFGIDNSSLIPDYATPEAKSFSHSLTLPKETSDRSYIDSILIYLCEKVARRMRADNFCGRVIFCNGSQTTLNQHTDDGLKIFQTARELLDYCLVKAIYVGISNLQKKKFTSLGLLPEFQREEKIISSLDLVNNRFGENTVFRAAALSAFSQDKKVAGIRGRFRFN